ncbi:MAG: hypothetical protein N2712_04910 [Brevinematales bacterium]|nr:hypothetical protein [Brevinematales bacterium]
MSKLSFDGGRLKIGMQVWILRVLLDEVGVVKEVVVWNIRV